VKVGGIILIVLGLVALIAGGISYTTQDKVFDAGPIHASVEKHHSIPLSPIAGGAAVLVGLVLIVSGKKT
jgi:hypothetical protein